MNYPVRVFQILPPSPSARIYLVVDSHIDPQAAFHEALHHLASPSAKNPQRLEECTCDSLSSSSSSSSSTGCGSEEAGGAEGTGGAAMGGVPPEHRPPFAPAPLDTLIADAQAAFAAMTPEQQEAMRQAQRESWARAEAAMQQEDRASTRPDRDEVGEFAKRMLDLEEHGGANGRIAAGTAMGTQGGWIRIARALLNKQDEVARLHEELQRWQSAETARGRALARAIPNLPPAEPPTTPPQHRK